MPEIQNKSGPGTFSGKNFSSFVQSFSSAFILATSAFLPGLISSSAVLLGAPALLVATTGACLSTATVIAGLASKNRYLVAAGTGLGTVAGVMFAGVGIAAGGAGSVLAPMMAVLSGGIALGGAGLAAVAEALSKYRIAPQDPEEIDARRTDMIESFSYTLAGTSLGMALSLFSTLHATLYTAKDEFRENAGPQGAAVAAQQSLRASHVPAKPPIAAQAWNLRNI